MHKNEKENGKKYAAPAVDSLLDILEFMAKNPRTFGPTELSRALGISANLVFRVLKRLVERKYAETNEEGTYSLSTRFFSLGMTLHSNFDLRRRARKHLEDLCSSTNETCQIQIPDGDRMLVLDVANPPTEFFFQVIPGSRLYYHANAFGKAVMAFMDEEELQQTMPEKLPSFTDNTVTSLKSLKSELSEITKTGIAYDREEYLKGIFCIGAPVFDVLGKACAGVGMTGISSRFDSAAIKKLEHAVLLCAEKISSDIGYTGKFFKGIAK